MAEATEEARAKTAKLVSDWDWPDPATLEDILALGDKAVPALAELLTPELLASAQTDEQADTTVYYALELLAALKTPLAIPVFLNAYRHVTDDTVEGLEGTLQSLGPEAVDPLLAVVADPSLSRYARALAANGAIQEANRDASLRPHVAAGLRAILAGLVERPDPLSNEEKEIAASLVADLAEMADPEARPLIAAAFASKRVLSAEEDETGFALIDEESVEELYAKGGSFYVSHPPVFIDDYRKRWQENRDRQENLERLKLLEREPALKTVVLGPKVGRNDPCWCGSGKKYKKCHLAQDEKEKVRL